MEADAKFAVLQPTQGVLERVRRKCGEAGDFCCSRGDVTAVHHQFLSLGGRSASEASVCVWQGPFFRDKSENPQLRCVRRDSHAV